MGNLLGAPVTEKETHTGVTAEGVRYGVSSMQGWRVHMEDAHIAEPRLYAAQKKVSNTNASETNNNNNGNNNQEEEDAKVTYIKLPLPGHGLFAVFDGHGGQFAATYSGQNMCRVLARQPRFVQYGEFVQERIEKEKTSTDTAALAEYIRAGLDLLELALCDAFVDLDREIACALKGTKVPDADAPYHNDEASNHAIMNLPEDGDLQQNPDGMEGVTANISESLSSPTDSALQLLEDEGDSGTTACVVVLTPDWVVCANAGDSRAVMSRATKAVPLSYDHKPDDEAEERRIRAGGGYVAGGRVEGDLAVSRGLGDFRFKNLDVVMAAEKMSHLAFRGQNNIMDATRNNYNGQRQPVTKPGDQKVSPIPDILVHNRNVANDEFILVACDGIWDVQTNYEAVKQVADIFQEGEANLGLICEEVLDLCLSMGSKDNMTALVVQLPGQKIPPGGGVLARRQLRQRVSDQAASNEDES